MRSESWAQFWRVWLRRVCTFTQRRSSTLRTTHRATIFTSTALTSWQSALARASHFRHPCKGHIASHSSGRFRRGSVHELVGVRFWPKAAFSDRSGPALVILPPCPLVPLAILGGGRSRGIVSKSPKRHSRLLRSELPFNMTPNCPRSAASLDLPSIPPGPVRYLSLGIG